MATIKGRWILDTSINTNADTQTAFNCAQNVNFTSNGENITQIAIGDNASVGYSTVIKYLIGSDLKTVYDGTGSGWTSAAYRTVDFGETEQEVSDDFRNWMDEHAVPRYSIKFKVDETEYGTMARSSWLAIADLYSDTFGIDESDDTVYLKTEPWGPVMADTKTVKSTDIVEEDYEYAKGKADFVRIFVADTEYSVTKWSLWSTIIDEYPEAFAIDESDSTIIWLSDQSGRVMGEDGIPVKATDRVITGAAYEAEEVYYIRGKWVLNNVIPAGTELAQSVNFTSNNQVYTSIHCDVVTAGKYTISCITYENEHVASGLDSVTWENPDFKAIDFGNAVQIVSKEFHDWFTTNAARVFRTVSGEWAFDETLELEPFEQIITFETSKYGTLYGIYSDGVNLYYKSGNYGDIIVYDSTGWDDIALRYVTFPLIDGVEQTMSEEFHTWFRKSAKEDAEEIKGRWKFDDYILPIVFDESVRFTSGSYTLVRIRSTGSKMFYGEFGGTTDVLAFTNDGRWTDPNLRILNFGEDTQIVSGKFFRWFTASADELTGDGSDDTLPGSTLVIPMSSTAMKLNTKNKICDRDIVVKMAIPTYKGETVELTFITFYVDNNEYQVEEGTMWADITAYYPEDFSIDPDDNTVYWKGSQIQDDSDIVTSDMIVTEGFSYNPMSG